jgi:hypothetical protein
MNADTKKIVGAVAQCLLTDLNNTSRLQQRLAESVGYGNGYEDGFADGMRVAQRNMQEAMTGVHIAAGFHAEGVE